MARLPGVARDDAPLGTKLAYFFTRRGMTQLTGKSPDGMLEPIQMYAYSPTLLNGYGKLEQAVGKLTSLDKRARALGELKAAAVVQCEYCMDLGSQISRKWGLTDDELLALATYRTSDLFDDRDRLVLDYAVAMTRTPADVPEALFTRMRGYFSEQQIVELTHIIALENLRARFNVAFGIGSVGFSDNAVCALPSPVDTSPVSTDASAT